MRDPQRREGKQGGGGKRAEAVKIKAQPRIDLPELFPPLIVDDRRGDGARAGQHQQDDNNQRDPQRALARPRAGQFVPGHGMR